MKISRYLPSLLLILLFTLSFNTVVEGQVTVVRGGEENPVVTIARSTLYGAATGVILGLALSLVVEEDTEDILKWSFVGGTFGGFLFGVYHVVSRPKPSTAMLEIDSNGFARFSLPNPEIRFKQGLTLDFRVKLLSISL